MNVVTVARPDSGCGATSALRHTGHTGPGGWIQYPHSPHRNIRNTPSAPDAQKKATSGVSSGSGRVMYPFYHLDDRVEALGRRAGARGVTT